MVREAPESIRAIWNLAHKELKILNANYIGLPRYIHSPSYKGIVLNLADDAVGKDAKSYKHIFHEAAHLIDHWMENYNSWFSVTYKSGIFAKILQEEADGYIKKKAKVENISIGHAKFEISKKLYLIDDMDVQEVSDIWDGTTKGTVNGGYGHDEKYWENPSNLPIEAFANMFAATIYNQKSLEQILKYFPKSYELFIKMLEDYIKESGSR